MYDEVIDVAKRVGRSLVWFVPFFLPFGFWGFWYEPGQSGNLARSADPNPQWSQVAHIMEEKCFACHSPSADLPFYADVPLAKQLIERDVKRGLAVLDMEKDLGRQEEPPHAETALAKLEYAIERNSMPPLHYLAIHWPHRLTEREKTAILEWVWQSRRTYYKTPTAPPAAGVEPLQPLPEPPQVHPAKLKLGRALFHDKRLSADSSISCASCHNLDLGGTDQKQVSEGVGGQKGPINSPTVYNAALHFRQFWDGRAADLVEQADGPVTNPIEMASEWPDVIEKLKADRELVRLANKAYRQGLTPKTVRDAIASFEQTLLTPSRFDAYLKGRTDALTAEEQRGYRLFKSVGCAMCHVGQAVGGQSFEKMGLHGDYFEDRGQITPADRGRFNVTQKEQDRHHFKVPSLRNVALTYPYYHDGSVKTLERAVKLMAEYQLDRDLEEAEVKAIVAFLHALTGEELSLPSEAPPT